MNKAIKYIAIVITFVLTGFIWNPGNVFAFSFIKNSAVLFLNTQDTTAQKEKIDLPFPFEDENNYTDFEKPESPIYLTDPSNVKRTIEYDPETGEYIFYEKMGDIDYRNPSTMTAKEYQDYRFEQSLREHWRQRARGEAGSQPSFVPKLKIGGETFDKIFGSNTINIIPQGEATLTFGVNINKVDNPSLSEELRRTTTFDFKESIKMNVTGKIGDKVEMSIQYDTDATFDFENHAKLEYTGDEDEIIKKVEIGNVTLPLSGSLITGSQSLFGVKTEMQFGKLTVTSIFSQQKGNASVINIEGGAQTHDFEIKADEYDANRHFFLNHYFRSIYETALKNTAIINSGITIERVEVWVTNKNSSAVDNRSVISYLDLGEGNQFIFDNDIIFQNIGKTYPDNDLNNLYALVKNDSIPNIDIEEGQDFEKINNARKLQPHEYTVNLQLGYISLNSALNGDEILAVAYEYSVGTGGRYKVGEFSADKPAGVLVTKLIKGTNLSPILPNWDLMMKNVYAIGAYQINSEDFILDVLYQDDRKGTSVNYLTEGGVRDKILLSVLNLDQLNSQHDFKPDGRFDFIEGITVNSSNGRIFFPVLEPFGSFLKTQINDPAIASKYVYQELYDSTQTKAKEFTEKNKFKLNGRYQSSTSSEIFLNAFNIPPGSVVVTAGSEKLAENIDYTVDYTSGRVNIINQGLLESGKPIRISLESNELFNLQTKTMLGSHLDYKISDNFNLGATILNLTEKPLTQKVNIGDEPISNTIWGLNGSYKTESGFVTSMIDKLPFLETKETSSITFEGEFANLIPGHSRAIGKSGTAYIDDFEGSETSYDLNSPFKWKLASIPRGQELKFPEGVIKEGTLISGYNRAKIAWYNIDQLFVENTSRTPGHIKANSDAQSSFFVTKFRETDLFKKDVEIESYLPILNVAFYPEEKGPYNYDYTSSSYGGTKISSGVNEWGTLEDPESRWAGIMREIISTDFETSNIQYIEFWLMDPFVENPDIEGGNLYFNLGNISEDILKDSKMSFENGLPQKEDALTGIDTTVWGRVPTSTPLVYTFDGAGQKNQDVGLDGLGNEDEQSFFRSYLDSVSSIVTDPVALEKINNDPSGDDYHYYRGSDYDAEQVGILQRYKKYNGLEGNSLPQEYSPESYSTTGTQYPDVEDIKVDLNLNETESYYQYRVQLISPEDLQVGKNFIVDKKVIEDYKFPNNDIASVSWYQFKIPIYDYETVVGPIQDFKSIRFMRMFFREFSDSVILRLAKFDLVRAEWRRYNLSLIRGREGLSEEIRSGTFEISSINNEENEDRYILPPGIESERDQTSNTPLKMKEQSIVLKVTDLQDGDARAAFKTASLDIRQYGKIKMNVHAERINDNPDVKYNIKDGELKAFIRMGSDYKNNYYEYEIPLRFTDKDFRPIQSSNDDKLIVWPNLFDIDLDVLKRAKLARNENMRQPGSPVGFESVYAYPDGENMVYVSGNPNLSNIKAIMIGIRNPDHFTNQGDDGLPKSAEVWMNELRLTDFNNKGGWAANGRVTTKLADFGTLTVAGTKSTPGFGSIEQKVNELSKEDIFQYDISTNLEMGKFFPEKSGVTVPLYFGFSESFINPQYNPLDPDITLKETLNSFDSKHDRDSLKKLVQEYTQRRSLNFTNVSINRQLEKPKFYDVSNWSLNYAYSEVYSRNINTEYYLQKSYKGGIGYLFNSAPKNITPFRQTKILKPKYLQLIRDFNFYYMPTSVSVRTDMDRYYNAVKARNIYNPDIKIDTTYVKDFIWNRYYDIKFDLTKSLKLDFSATNIARIDEPDGPVNKKMFRDRYEYWKDSVLSNIKRGGRTTQYYHNIDITYNAPINKIPLLDWTGATARYSATYGWDAGPQNYRDSLGVSREIGNTIKNTRSTQLSGRLNMVNLYNKAGFLKRVNQKYQLSSKARSRAEEKKYKTLTFEKKGVALDANVAKSIYHNLMTEDVTVTVTEKGGERIKATVEVVSEKRVKITTDRDYPDVDILVEGKIEKSNNPLTIVAEHAALLLMSVKDINLNYSLAEGTIVPGYKPKTKLFGQERYNNILAPGMPFILGYQDRDYLDYTARNGWLVSDVAPATPYQMTNTENIMFRSTVEPVKGLKIDLTANKTYSEIFSELYSNYDNVFTKGDPLVSGSFSMSFITWGTAFEKISPDNNYYSNAYEKFLENRQVISQRLGVNRPLFPGAIYGEDTIPEYTATVSEGFIEGYGPFSQDVLIPSFLAAYGKMDAGKITLKTFPVIPLPNWRINYDGLSQIELVKRYFKSVNITHSYRSTYNISSFIANPEFVPEDNGYSYIRNADGNNFLPRHQINSVSITEQFSPLINIDLTFENNITVRLGLKKDRMLSLSFSNNWITEKISKEKIIGLGYRFDEVNLFYRAGGTEKSIKSDLKIQCDLSFKNDLSVIRKIFENQTEAILGQHVVSLKTSADYVLSDWFNVKLFFDRVINKPIVSTGEFPRTNTNVGVSFRFTLVQ